MTPVRKRPRKSSEGNRHSVTSQASTCLSSTPSPFQCKFVSRSDEHCQHFETPECTEIVSFASLRTPSTNANFSPPSLLPSEASVARTGRLGSDARDLSLLPFCGDSVQRNVFDQLCSMASAYSLTKAGSETLNRRMRWQLVAWIGEVCRTFKLAEFTYSLSVNYMDHILAKSDIDIDELQLLAGCCVLLAGKINEIRPPAFQDMAIVCGQESAACLVEMEKHVLEMLNYNLSTQTPHGVVGWLVIRAAHGMPGDGRAQYAVRYAQFALSAGLHDLFVTRCPPASVAVAAVFVAFAVARLPNTSLAEWTHLPQVAPAVAHTILACRSIVSRTRENAEFLAMWNCEANAFKGASTEIAMLLENSLPTPRALDGDHSQPPSSLEQYTLKERSATCVDSDCSSRETPEYTIYNVPHLVGRKRTNSAVWWYCLAFATRYPTQYLAWTNGN